MVHCVVLRNLKTSTYFRDLHHLLPVLVQDKNPRVPHLIDLLHLGIPHTQGHAALDILPQAANLHELKHLGCIPLRWFLSGWRVGITMTTMNWWTWCQFWEHSVDTSPFVSLWHVYRQLFGHARSWHVEPKSPRSLPTQSGANQRHDDAECQRQQAMKT